MLKCNTCTFWKDYQYYLYCIQMNLIFIFTLKTFWILHVVLFSYLAVISRRWQASRKRMWYPPYNIWTWSTTTRDSTSSPYRTNRLTPRTRQWRNGKYESTPSVCTGNPRIGASGASGERRRQDLRWKYQKIAVITTELVAHDELQAKWFGVWRRVLSCSSIAWVEGQYLASNEIIDMVYLFLWCSLICRSKGTELCNAHAMAVGNFQRFLILVSKMEFFWVM